MVICLIWLKKILINLEFSDQIIEQKTNSDPTLKIIMIQIWPILIHPFFLFSILNVQNCIRKTLYMNYYYSIITFKFYRYFLGIFDPQVFKNLIHNPDTNVRYGYIINLNN